VAAPLVVLLLFQRPGRRESVLALALLAYLAWSVSGGGEFARFEHGWVFLLAGGLVVATALRPPERSSLMATGLLAVGVAAVAGVVLIGITAFSFDQLRWLAERHYGGQARMLVRVLATAAGPEPTAEVSAVIGAVESSALATARAVATLLPALVLLQSVAALAAAWAVYRAVARHPEGASLPRLREFRFSDHLIWGVVAALIALVLPGLAALRSVGLNLAVFFGGLYVARGLGVLAALAAAVGFGGPLAVTLVTFVTLFLLPIAAVTALAVGVTDTWVDWRKLTANRRSG
jgi:hypothetical protein